MVGRRWIQGLAGLAVAALVLAPVLASDKLYRYRNADDVLVIHFSVPVEYVAKGYDILAPDGRLIETVAPQGVGPTIEERLKSGEQQQRDAFILRSYSSVSDVERARDRRLSLLQRDIDILVSNIRDLRHRHDQLREQAANYQASGSAPLPATETVIHELRQQERSAEELLAERRGQHRELASRYAAYAARLVELKSEQATNSNRLTRDGEQALSANKEPSANQEPSANRNLQQIRPALSD